MTDTSNNIVGTMAAGPEGVSLHMDETRSIQVPRRRSREDWPRRLRRAEVPKYVHDMHGVIVASASLAKLAVVGGGPVHELWGRIPYYPTDLLDQWVEARLSLRRSTSEARGHQSPRRATRKR